MGLKNHKEWLSFARSKDKPYNIPSRPEKVYKDKGWIGFRDWLGTTIGWDGEWEDFLGTGTVATQNKLFLTYEKASELVIKLKIKTYGEWTLFKKSSTFHKYNLAKAPETVYKDKGWKGYPSFFGKIKVEKYDLIAAKKYIKTKKIKTLKEWQNFSKTDRPEFIPSNPQRLYRDKGWKGWDDFLGKE